MGLTSTVPEMGNVPSTVSAVPTGSGSGNEAQRTTWLSDALLIAGVPAALYLLTLSFQFGFAITFDVPFQFITVSWTDVFVIGLFLFASAFGLFALGALIFTLPRNKRTPSYLRSLKLMPLIMLLADFVYVISTDWRVLLQIGSFVAFVLGIISGWISHREEEIHEKVDPHGFRRWRIGVVAFLWAVSGVMTSTLAGGLDAKHQREFYVSNGSPETVVLGIWGDTVVTAPFDRQTKIVKRDFMVTKISDHSPLNIRAENIGPLHIETLH